MNKTKPPHIAEAMPKEKRDRTEWGGTCSAQIPKKALSFGNINPNPTIISKVNPHIYQFLSFFSTPKIFVLVSVKVVSKVQPHPQEYSLYSTFA